MMLHNLLVAAALLPAATSTSPTSPQDARTGQNLVIEADLLLVGDGTRYEDAVLVLRDGLVSAVGPRDSVAIPDEFERIRAAVATPGFVDAHTCVGLAGFLNVDAVNDEYDPSAPIQPELRALDAFHRQDPLVDWVRGFGVTTVHTGHAPSGIMSGTSMIVKTAGDSLESSILEARGLVTACLGEGAQVEGGPGTRAKTVALLRQALIDGLAYGEKEDPERDLRLEVLGEVARGERPVLVTAHRANDLRSALRLAEEFSLDLVLDGASEAYDLITEIREAGVAVLVHPTMARSGGEQENLAMTTAAKLSAAGIPIALQSGYEAYVPRSRVLLFEAAAAVRYGLSEDAALRSITLGAAEILGVSDRVGSLEIGKHGDVALSDGDPFETVSHCTGTVIEGRLVSQGERTGR